MPPRFRVSHLFGIIIIISASLYLFTDTSPSSSTSPGATGSHSASILAFCPHSTKHSHTPTVILQADAQHAPLSNRTFWLGDLPGQIPPSFAPYAYPPRDLRFAQRLPTTNNRPFQDDSAGSQVCQVHNVPSSPPPPVPKDWVPNKIMFGMSTTPDRVLYNLPVWSNWLPSAKRPLDPKSAEAKALPVVVILTPPPSVTEAMRTREAVDEAQARGMHVVMRAKESDRFETRYFALAEEMWNEAVRREEQDGIVTEWFVFSDDDTFFPDFDSLVRLLSTFPTSSDTIIGALSESTKQVAQWGHIAYGGAGIHVSRPLMAKMNAPGVWNECLAKFGASFGGDAMVSHCAALALDKPVKEILTIEDTLHQLDIRGDGTGWFQSGFLITSLHHWGSWFTLFPPWHESGAGDLRKGIALVGKAAKGVTGDNWGRRYVFEEGKVVVALGYSVTIHARAMTKKELGASEHTWWEFETFHPVRAGLEEARDKRTYYLTNVRPMAPGVVKLEHKNREGERVDVVWDGRATGKGKGWW